MTRKISLITAVGAALVLAAPVAWAKPAPDVVQRAVTQRANDSTLQYVQALNARGEALNQQYRLGEHATNAIDARERAFGAKLEAQLTTMPGPDVVERAAAAHVGESQRPLVGDGGDRFRIDPANGPVTSEPVSSGREIEWPQIGFGVGLGIVFVLGLMLVFRTTRRRELAH